MAKTHRVKCRHCGKGFNEPVGKFPKRLFAHIKKRHPGAARKHRPAPRTEKKVLRKFEREYGTEEGKRIFYATEAKQGIFHPHGCRCDGCK
jgi:hypothetical protein